MIEDHLVGFKHLIVDYSGRLRALGQKYKVSSETRNDIQVEKRNARIEFLEDDNFVRAKELKEDDEFAPEDDGTRSWIVHLHNHRQCVVFLQEKKSKK